MHGPAEAGVCVHGHGVNNHQRPCGCPQPGLTPETMGMSEGHAAHWGHTDQSDLLHADARDHVCVHGPIAAWVYVEVQGLYYNQKPCRCP